MGLRLTNGINLKHIKKYLKINNVKDIININGLKKYFEISDKEFKVKSKYFNILDSLILKLI